MERVGATVIGGGAVGLSVLLELARAGLENVFLLEKHDLIGQEQSSRNSGVVHSGIFEEVGSLKARLCVASNPLLYEFCSTHGIPALRVGKLIVAATPDEVAGLERLHAQAVRNDVPEVSLLSREQVRELEPGVEAVAALHVPSSGMFDAAAYTNTLARLAEAHGAHILLSFEVTAVEAAEDHFVVTGMHDGHEEVFATDVLINAAGLYADQVARMINPDMRIGNTAPRVVALRGEFYKFNHRRRPALQFCGANIYPLPQVFRVDGNIAGYAVVHFTPTFDAAEDGTLTIGDTVLLGPVFKRVARKDDYATDRVPADVFLEQVRRYYPALEMDDLEQDFCGVMAWLHGHRDFVIERDRRYPHCIQLLGLDSPALTASLGIAREVRRLVDLS